MDTHHTPLCQRTSSYKWFHFSFERLTFRHIWKKNDHVKDLVMSEFRGLCKHEQTPNMHFYH